MFSVTFVFSAMILFFGAFLY